MNKPRQTYKTNTGHTNIFTNKSKNNTTYI